MAQHSHLVMPQNFALLPVQTSWKLSIFTVPTFLFSPPPFLMGFWSSLLFWSCSCQGHLLTPQGQVQWPLSCSLLLDLSVHLTCPLSWNTPLLAATLRAWWHAFWFCPTSLVHLTAVPPDCFFTVSFAGISLFAFPLLAGVPRTQS